MAREVPVEEVKRLADTAGGHKFTERTLFVLAGTRLFFRSAGVWLEAE
jgi:hypothetical protein